MCVLSAVCDFIVSCIRLYDRVTEQYGRTFLPCAIMFEKKWTKPVFGAKSKSSFKDTQNSSGGFSSQRPSNAELPCFHFCNHLQAIEQGSSCQWFEMTWGSSCVSRFIRWSITIFYIILSTKKKHHLLITFRPTEIQSSILCSLSHRQNIVYYQHKSLSIFYALKCICYNDICLHLEQKAPLPPVPSICADINNSW